MMLLQIQFHDNQTVRETSDVRELSSNAMLEWLVQPWNSLGKGVHKNLGFPDLGIDAMMQLSY